MVAYNFKSQFAPLIETGHKTQTIRSIGKRRPPVPGEELQLYTGQRTKYCRKLLSPDPLCLSVTLILIHYELGIKLDDRWLTRDECEALAVADGFDSYSAFFRFFKDTHGLPFKGVLIQWALVGPPAGNGNDPTRVQLVFAV